MGKFRIAEFDREYGYRIGLVEDRDLRDLPEQEAVIIAREMSDTSARSQFRAVRS